MKVKVLSVFIVEVEHEETCEFRPYSCPCPGASCKWQGSLEQVMAHLMQVSCSAKSKINFVERRSHRFHA